MRHSRSLAQTPGGKPLGIASTMSKTSLHFKSEPSPRPALFDGRRALVYACLGGLFALVGALFGKAFNPTLMGWFSSYPAWVFPALVVGLLAAMTLAGLLLPPVLRRLRSRKRADA